MFYQLTATRSGHLRNSVRSGDLYLYFTYGEAPAGPDFLHRAAGCKGSASILPADRAPQEELPGSRAQLAGQLFIVGCIYRQISEDVFSAGRAARPRVAAEVGSVAA